MRGKKTKHNTDGEGPWQTVKAYRGYPERDKKRLATGGGKDSEARRKMLFLFEITGENVKNCSRRGGVLDQVKVRGKPSVLPEEALLLEKRGLE